MFKYLGNSFNFRNTYGNRPLYLQDIFLLGVEMIKPEGDLSLILRQNY